MLLCRTLWLLVVLHGLINNQRNMVPMEEMVPLCEYICLVIRGMNKDIL